MFDKNANTIIIIPENNSLHKDHMISNINFFQRFSVRPFGHCAMENNKMFTGNGIDTAINHYSTRLDPISFDEFGNTNGNHQNISRTALTKRIQTTISLINKYISADINLVHTTSGRFLVLEWHTVTVAWFHFSNSDTGVPTILLRPKTTARAPTIGTPLRLINSMQPCGVHGMNPVKLPMAVRPSFSVCKLSDFENQIITMWDWQ